MVSKNRIMVHYLLKISSFSHHLPDPISYYHFSVSVYSNLLSQTRMACRIVNSAVADSTRSEEPSAPCAVIPAQHGKLSQ